MSESSTYDPDRDSAEQPPSYNDLTVNTAPDGSQDVAVEAPSHIDATVDVQPSEIQEAGRKAPSHIEGTVDASPGALQEAGFELPSHHDATVDAPPSDFQEPGGAPPSHMDATVDAPPSDFQDAGFELGSHLDATVDAPPSTPDDSRDMTVDHLPTEERDGAAAADGATFKVSTGSAKVEAKAKNRIANYEILGVLGRGAVGVVYKAKQIGLNRLVALKMLLAGSHASQRDLARFRVEAEAVARLRHPNIVQVYEVGEHNGLPFFSLEFVEGGSLHGKMDGKPLTPQSAAEIMVQLCQAMHFAHEHNIIHRDLKPANILLTPDGIPKITDFGLAKRLEENEESSQTKTGTLMGTPSYMPPEQAEGRTHDIGPLSDQYTLGAILYELLTGRPPFLGATLLETIQQVRNQEPVPPTQLQPTTPQDLEVICLKGLQKDPKKRYHHAGEMAEDLQRFLNHEPIHARAVSRTERVWRWCRRNPRVASLYASVAVLVMLVLVSGGVLGFRMLREQQTIGQVRDQVVDRLNLATNAIFDGNVQEAKTLLSDPNPLLASTAGLSELHDRWHNLDQSIGAFGEFKNLLDQVRFAYIFGARSSRKQLEQGREDCRKLLAMYDAIEQDRMPLPPLNDEQQKLFKDDVFDMFLLSALIEDETALNAGRARQREVEEQAIDWLNRADKILPGLRTLHAQRSGFHGRLGHRQADEEDHNKALSIEPTSAVDHFWHGYAEDVRGNIAKSKGEADKAREYYRSEMAEYAALLEQHPNHFWGYYQWASAKMHLGEYQDALIGFTTCMRLRSDFPWPYNSRGSAHLGLKQYDQAIRDFDTALEKDRDYVMARSNRALAYLLQNKIDEAFEDCNEVVKQDPRYAEVYLHRAECYRRKKQYEDALADCTRVLALHQLKEDVHAKREAIYEEMKEAGDATRSKRAVDLDHKKAFEFYTQALKHVSRGEYHEALGDYNAAVELYPQALEPHHYRAVLYWLYLKDFDAALRDWRHITLLWSKKPDAYRFLTMIHVGRRQYDLALEDATEALSRKPEYPEVIWAKAQIYLWQGKAKEALDVVNPLAQKLPPNAQTTLNVRGDIYRSLGRLDEAAADYRRLMQLKPDNVESYVGLALIHVKQGQPAKACQVLDQLVQANPKLASAYLERGRFLRNQGQFDEAWKDSEEAARCDATSALPALLQASITAARGDPAAAVAAADRTLAEAPKDNGQVLYAAAQVWSLASAAALRAGDRESAQRYADLAVEFLAQTLDKGFHDLVYPEHNRMIDDPALEAIRQHPKAGDLLAHRPPMNKN